MENKNVGWLVIGISIIIVFIIFLFNKALKDIIAASCGTLHGESCPMLVSVNQQTYLALAIVAILIVLGIVLIFSKPDEKIIVKKIPEKKKPKKVDLAGFRAEEKKIYNIVKESKTIFQADLIEKSGFGKVKISRILDKLEGNNLVERKRRGMINVVVLKD